LLKVVTTRRVPCPHNIDNSSKALFLKAESSSLLKGIQNDDVVLRYRRNAQVAPRAMPALGY